MAQHKGDRGEVPRQSQTYPVNDSSLMMDNERSVEHKFYQEDKKPLIASESGRASSILLQSEGTRANERDGQPGELTRIDEDGQEENEEGQYDFPKTSSSYVKFMKDDVKLQNKEEEKRDVKPQNKEEEKKLIPEEENKEERKEMNRSELFLDDVSKKESNYEVKRGFMSSELKQCIQNPKKEKQDEIITVHKCILNAGFADSNQSVDRMKQNKLKPEELVVSYKMDEEIKDVNTSRGRKQHNIDATKVKFEKPISTAKFVKPNTPTKPHPQQEIPEGFGINDDVSIISFWKQKDQRSNNFYCYHFFYIKNLIERDDRSLFEAENQNLFLIHKNSNYVHELVLLDLDKETEEMNEPLIAHDHVSTNAFKQIFQLADPKLETFIDSFKNFEVQFQLYSKKPIQAEDKPTQAVETIKQIAQPNDKANQNQFPPVSNEKKSIQELNQSNITTKGENKQELTTQGENKSVSTTQGENKSVPTTQGENKSVSTTQGENKQEFTSQGENKSVSTTQGENQPEIDKQTEYFLLVLQRTNPSLQVSRASFHIFNFIKYQANPFAMYVSETDFIFLNYDQKKDHINILELDGEKEQILSLRPGKEDQETIQRRNTLLSAKSQIQGQRSEDQNIIHQVNQRLSALATFAEVKPDGKAIKLDFKQSDIYDISYAVLHNEGQRLTIVGPAKVGGHIALSFIKVDETQMCPMSYIKDVINRQEMLFMGDQLWINTFKRQDQKNMFQSHNVSDFTIGEQIIKQFKDKKENIPLSFVQSNFASQIFKPNPVTFLVEVKSHQDLMLLPTKQSLNSEKVSDQREKFKLCDINELSPETSSVTDYPICAYKSISPDNKEIVLMHLSLKIPQRSIHLGKWEFLSFVDGKFKFEDTRKQILMLIKNSDTQKIKLAAIFIDPWKHIDFQYTFDLPESIFLVKNCDIQLPPQSNRFKNLSLGLQIKRIYMLHQIKKSEPETNEIDHYTMIVQLKESLHFVSMKGKTEELADQQSMTPQFMTQDQLGRVFYAEQSQGKTKIQMITLSDDLKVQKKVIYQMNCELIAIDCDNCLEVLEDNRSRIFTFGSDDQMYHLRQRKKKESKKPNKPEKEFECLQTYDFSLYGEDYLVRENWEVCSLDKGVITSKEFLIPGATQNFKLYKPLEQNVIEWTTKVDISHSVQRIRETQAIFSISRNEENSKRSFIFRPTLDGKGLFLFAVNDRKIKNTNINRISFVREDRLLYQFVNIPELDQKGRVTHENSQTKKYKTVIVKPNGEIIQQSKLNQVILENEITGGQELQFDDQSMFTSISDTKELMVYKFTRDGTLVIDLQVKQIDKYLMKELSKKQFFGQFQESIKLHSENLILNQRTIIMFATVQPLQNGSPEDYKMDLHPIYMNGWSIKVILIKPGIENFFDTFDFKAVGDYLCYKQKNETKISVRKIYSIADSQINAQSSNFSQQWTSVRSIKLDNFFLDDQSKEYHILFEGISQFSYLNCRMKQEILQVMKRDKKKSQKDQLHSDYINVVVGNQSFVYNLNENEQKGCLHQLDSIDSFNSFGGLCNTGLTPYSWTKNNGLFQGFTNQQASLNYFKQIRNQKGQKMSEYINLVQRTYSLKDMCSLERISNCMKNSFKFNFGDDTLTSVIEGHSIFSIFEGDERILQQIIKQLNKRKFLDQKDTFKNKVQNALLRKISMIINAPTLQNINPEESSGEEKNQDPINFSSVCHRSNHGNKFHLRDCLLQICAKCTDFDITQFVTSVDDMETLITTSTQCESSTQMILEAFRNNWSRQFKTLTEIESFQMPLRKLADFKGFNILTDCEDISKKGIEDLIQHEIDNPYDTSTYKYLCIMNLFEKIGDRLGFYRRKKSAQLVFVQVNLVPLDWIVDKKGASQKLLKLIPILEDIDDEQLFQTPFIDALKETTIRLRYDAFLFCFLPYMIQMFVSLIYFSNYVLSDEQDKSLTCRFLQFGVATATVYFSGIEILQFNEIWHDEGRSYIFSTNFYDLVSIIANYAILVNEILERKLFSIISTPYIVAVAVLLIWLRFFYWLRVFERPAFFIHLITETIYGTFSFLFLMTVLLLLFANVLYVFNVSNHSYMYLDDQTLYPEEIENQYFINSLIHFYLIALGEFSFDDYGTRGKYQKWIIWVWFVIATFMVQITVMNMLIAIMGQIFEKIYAKEQIAKMKERLELLEDLKPVLSTFKVNNKKRYLLVVRPKNLLDDYSLETQINSIITQVEEQHYYTKKEVNQKFEDQMFQTKILEKKLDENGSSYDELKVQMGTLDAKMGNLDAKMEKIITMIGQKSYM